jgi:hypothetical protein
MVSAAGKKMPVLVSPSLVIEGAAAEPSATVTVLNVAEVPAGIAKLRLVVLRYRTYTLLVPDDGATENVRVVPDTE